MTLSFLIVDYKILQDYLSILYQIFGILNYPITQNRYDWTRVKRSNITIILLFQLKKLLCHSFGEVI